MNAESSRVLQTDMWTEWENHLVNRTYPLRRFLGGSVHSGVFLTEFRTDRALEAAIKLVPADRVQTEDQLLLWGTAATLSHPHLIRFFDVGRCQLRGRPFLFVVMEYAEQTLAQLLPRRALGVDEILELLPPTLDVLAFLHRNYLVHGQVKPSNFLVVNDQIKLASDTLRPIGNTNGLARASLYDPPELKDGLISPAGDVWALGITLVQALTQRAPAWLDDRSEKLSLPVTLPPQFVDVARVCLSRDPLNRPTVIELEVLCKPAPPADTESAAEPPVLAQEQPREAAATALEAAVPTLGAPKSALGPLVLITVLVLAVAGWLGLRIFRAHHDAEPGTSDAAQVDSQSAPASAAGGQTLPLTEASADTEPGASRSSVTGSTGAAQPARGSADTEPGASRSSVTGSPGAAQPARGSADTEPGASRSSVTGSTGAAQPARGSPASALAASSEAASGPAASGSAASGQGTSRSTASGSAASGQATSRSAGSGLPAWGSTPSGSAASASTVSRPAAPGTPALAVNSHVSANSIVARAATSSSADSGNGSGATLAPAAGQSPATDSPSAPILQRVMPEVPATILGRIRGHINVRVRVLVDPAGDVVGQFLESAGPSRYFARVAGDAAGGWKFAPAEARDARVWLLQFEFTRAGATVQAAASP